MIVPIHVFDDPDDTAAWQSILPDLIAKLRREISKENESLCSNSSR
jgi:hypothetical protein